MERRLLSVCIFILLELLRRRNPTGCLWVLDLAYLSLGVDVSLVNDLVHLLCSLLQLRLLLCKLNITTLGRMLDEIWQERCVRSRDWSHIGWVHVVHLLSRASDCLWLSLDEEMLLTCGGKVRRLTRWYQRYEFIADWWSTLVVLSLVYNFRRDRLLYLESLRLILMLWLCYERWCMLELRLELLSMYLVILNYGVGCWCEVIHIVTALGCLMHESGLELRLLLVDLINLGCHWFF